MLKMMYRELIILIHFERINQTIILNVQAEKMLSTTVSSSQWIIVNFWTQFPQDRVFLKSRRTYQFVSTQEHVRIRGPRVVVIPTSMGLIHTKHQTNRLQQCLIRTKLWNQPMVGSSRGFREIVPKEGYVSFSRWAYVSYVSDTRYFTCAGIIQGSFMLIIWYVNDLWLQTSLAKMDDQNPPLLPPPRGRTEDHEYDNIAASPNEPTNPPGSQQQSPPAYYPQNCPPPALFPPPLNAPQPGSQAQQQQQSTTVFFASNPLQPSIPYEPNKDYVSFAGPVILSCLTAWIFGIVFGTIAFVAAS